MNRAAQTGATPEVQIHLLNYRGSAAALRRDPRIRTGSPRRHAGRSTTDAPPSRLTTSRPNAAEGSPRDTMRLGTAQVAQRLIERREEGRLTAKW